MPKMSSLLIFVKNCKFALFKLFLLSCRFDEPHAKPAFKQKPPKFVFQILENFKFDLKFALREL